MLDAAVEVRRLTGTLGVRYLSHVGGQELVLFMGFVSIFAVGVGSRPVLRWFEV